jgi:hypothetical protein
MEPNKGFGVVGGFVMTVSSVCRKFSSFSALLLLLFAILSSSGCTGIAGSPNNASQDPAPGASTLSVAPDAIKFGSVGLGGTLSQSVTLTNHGASNITITQASTKAAGVTITGMTFPLTIAAGKQANFNVVFSPKTAGVLSGAVTVVSDASATPSTVTLSGTGLAASAFLSMSTSSLKFGSVAIGKRTELSVVLTNAGNSNVTVSKVSVSGTQYSVNGVSAGLILAPGQSATLNETFAPTAMGTLPGSVTVVSNASNSPSTISATGDGIAAGSHSVSLSWAPSSSAVAGYNVYRSEVSGGPYSKLDPAAVTATSYTDSTVLAGQTYYFVVTSVSATGLESADSTEVSATVPTP